MLSVKGLGLLTLKPMIYCANVSEGDLADQGAKNTHVKVRAAYGLLLLSSCYDLV